MGTRVGEYVLGEVIGSGSFGTVYAAQHPVIQQPAAVKVLALRYSVDREMVARFIDEARATSRIEHPSIIKIFSFGRLEDGRRYHVMERLFGEPLDAHLRRVGALEPAAALAILRPIAGALAAAAAAGVVHRDVKPENIFLTQTGEVKLLDFGVAKLRDGASHAQRTATGVPIGTPAYMAPEQCLGEAVGPRADVYALGVVAYQMLTGQLPYDVDTSFEMMAAHLGDPIPALHRSGPYASAATQAIRAMMAKAPEARPEDPVAAIEALAAGLALPPRSAWKITLLLLTLALVAALGWQHRSHQARPLVEPRVDAEITDAAPARAEPRDAAAPPPRPPELITLRLNGLPKDTRAVIAGETFVLGAGDQALKLPRDEAPIKVVLSAPGRRPQVLTVVPNQDHSPIIELRRLTVSRRKPKPVKKLTKKEEGSIKKAEGSIKRVSDPHGIDRW